MASAPPAPNNAAPIEEQAPPAFNNVAPPPPNNTSTESERTSKVVSEVIETMQSTGVDLKLLAAREKAFEEAQAVIPTRNWLKLKGIWNQAWQEKKP